MILWVFDFKNILQIMTIGTDEERKVPGNCVNLCLFGQDFVHLSATCGQEKSRTLNDGEQIAVSIQAPDVRVSSSRSLFLEVGLCENGVLPNFGLRHKPFRQKLPYIEAKNPPIIPTSYSQPAEHLRQERAGSEPHGWCGSIPGGHVVSRISKEHDGIILGLVEHV